MTIDATDRKILGLLIRNARMPFLEIARECGISGAAIHQRVKKMEESGLLTSRIETDGGLQAKRVYEITDEGRVCLVFWRATLLDYRDRIDRLARAIPETIDDGM